VRFAQLIAELSVLLYPTPGKGVTECIGFTADFCEDLTAESIREPQFGL
jgi:hypothetical protein